jgi:hypothetical protein
MGQLMPEKRTRAGSQDEEGLDSTIYMPPPKVVACPSDTAALLLHSSQTDIVQDSRRTAPAESAPATQI